VQGGSNQWNTEPQAPGGYSLHAKEGDNSSFLTQPRLRKTAVAPMNQPSRGPSSGAAADTSVPPLRPLVTLCVLRALS